MFKLSLREDTRQGHLDLAKEHLKSGQARIAPAPSNGEEKAPTGADIKRKPLPVYSHNFGTLFAKASAP